MTTRHVLKRLVLGILLVSLVIVGLPSSAFSFDEPHVTLPPPPDDVASPYFHILSDSTVTFRWHRMDSTPYSWGISGRSLSTSWTCNLALSPRGSADWKEHTCTGIPSGVVIIDVDYQINAGDSPIAVSHFFWLP